MFKAQRKISLFILVAFFLLPVEAAAQQISEYDMKAVLLEKFSQFVEWPDNTGITDTSKPFIIGILGKSPFGSILDAYASQKIKDKTVEIRYFSDLKDISDCHLLFIARSKRRELPDILNITKDKPILTISDTGGWAKKGVLINLIFTQNFVNFEINEDAVKESGLEMKYHLKSMATKIVHFDEL